MKKEIIGIVAEFNPLHDGHKYLISSIKEKNPNATIIVAMSGQFVQRGEMAIFDKWSRSKDALNHGIDLVIEIPPFYVLNSANIFSKKAIEILSDFHVTDLYFGTENLDMKEIETIVNKIESESEKLNELKRKFHSLPKAFEAFIGKKLKPNDILGICYLLANNELNSKINFHRIERSSKKFSSASTIRNNIFKENYSSLDTRNLDEFKDFIIGKLVTTTSEDNTLKYLKKQYLSSKEKTLTEFINESSNSSYTKSRLRRDLMRFILDIKDQDKRIILGFNKNGQDVLRDISNYEFRHTKDNDNNLKVEEFISLKESNLKEQLSMSSIIKK